MEFINKRSRNIFKEHENQNILNSKLTALLIKVFEIQHYSREEVTFLKIH